MLELEWDLRWYRICFSIALLFWGRMLIFAYWRHRLLWLGILRGTKTVFLNGLIRSSIASFEFPVTGWIFFFIIFQLKWSIILSKHPLSVLWLAVNWCDNDCILRVDLLSLIRLAAHGWGERGGGGCPGGYLRDNFTHCFWRDHVSGGPLKC